MNAKARPPPAHAGSKSELLILTLQLTFATAMPRAKTIGMDKEEQQSVYERYANDC